MGTRLPTPLVSAAELRGLLSSGGRELTLLDVRWDLAGGAARAGYRAGHIPGATFVDLDRELSGPPGAGGRHPLPQAEDFAAGMRAAGLGGQSAAVVYDARTSLAAARAWWLLRYFGHPVVAVLDGGLAAWVAAGGSLGSGDPEPVAPGDFSARPGGMAVLNAAGAAALASGGGVLLDARAPERFSGEIEPLDPVAGHIPGARNLPMAQTLESDGRFRTSAAVRSSAAEAGVTDAAAIGAYCGSGITAAHQVLALELAGFAAALYPGSWSEWITDPERPVAVGSTASIPLRDSAEPNSRSS
jgi:thiosulfate/3-mercaptopyruvate sulfurtransferase